MPLIITLLSCDGNSGGGSTAPASFSVSGSQDVLKTANLANIEAYHCLAYNADQTNAQAAFGCLLAKAGRLAESAPVVDLLAAFGESSVNVQNDILEPSNADALFTKLARQSNLTYFDFPRLPFATFHVRQVYGNAEAAAKSVFRELLLRLKNGNVPLSRLQDDFHQMLPALEEMSTLLAVCRAASGFSFTLPKELYQGSRDYLIRSIDIEGFHAGIAGARVGIQLLDAYDLGVVPVRFMGSAQRTSGGSTFTVGDLLEREFVDDANGVGGDGKKFAELRSGQGNASALLPLATTALDSFISVVDGIQSSSAPSDVFRVVIGQTTGRAGKRELFADIAEWARYLRQSISTPNTLITPNAQKYPRVQLNVTGFLAGLPDPRTVQNADPFVVDRNGKVREVLAFFRTLLNGLATF